MATNCTAKFCLRMSYAISEYPEYLLLLAEEWSRTAKLIRQESNETVSARDAAQRIMTRAANEGLTVRQEHEGSGETALREYAMYLMHLINGSIVNFRRELNQAIIDLNGN